MDKQTVSRPLAVASAAFTVSVIIFALLREFVLWAAAAFALLTLLSALPGRLRSRRMLLITLSALFGILWCFLHSLVLRGAVDALAEMADAGTGIFHIPSRIASALGDSITRVFPERAAPFIRAITIGDAAELRAHKSVYSTLAVSGIAHIVSVSGMHVSFLVAVITPLLACRRRRAAVAIPVLLLFMVITGCKPSIVRAVVMQSFVIIAPLFKRRSDSITSIFSALLLLLLFDPSMIAGIGLQLSFLSTLGLILLTPRLYTMLSELHKKLPVLRKRASAAMYRFIAASLATSLGAIAFSTPLVAYYFGYISLYAPFTNLVTLWASAFCFCGGLLAAIFGLLSTAVGTAAAYIAAIPCDWVLLSAKAISRIPFAAVYVSNPYILGWLVYLYATGAFLIAARGRLRAVLVSVSGAVVTLCAALLLSALSPVGGLEITVLDVGQGQSIVVTDTGASAVIDCGGSYSSNASRAAASYLQERAISPVDMLILTHFHYDHAGGVPELLSLERFRMLVIPDPELGGGSGLTDEILELAREREIEIIIVDTTTVFNFGSSEITVFPPYGDRDENESCLTILVSDGDWDALVTGDMPSDTELLLLEYAGLPDVEMYVAGHHGSRYSSSYDLLEAVLPEIVIISVGENNTYGHPNGETLERFADIGAEVYRTDVSGNITVKSR